MARKPSRPAAVRSTKDTPPADETPIRVTAAQVLDILARGAMEAQGLLPYSSNHSFLVTIAADGITLPAVYKPRRGESPLWDFEWGTLCQRETAAYAISAALDWDLVPPTVLREGTHGIGSVQLFVPNDENEHYFTVQSDARFAAPLRRLALFDYVINNADRKSGHCLIGEDAPPYGKRLWAIDHGICFHSEYKLRTVIWEFSDEAIEAELIGDLQDLCDQVTDGDQGLGQMLRHLLSREEYTALLARIHTLLRKGTYPAPPYGRRNYPWPPV